MEIVTKESFLTVGLKIDCLEHELFVKMPKLYQTFYERMSEIKNIVNNHVMDICLERDGPRYTQYLCLEVTTLNDIPNDMTGIKIENAKYLYHHYQGDAEGIYDAFVLMYDYALKEKIDLDSKEFKIEVSKENSNYDLNLRLK